MLAVQAAQLGLRAGEPWKHRRVKAQGSPVGENKYLKWMDGMPEDVWLNLTTLAYLSFAKNDLVGTRPPALGRFPHAPSPPPPAAAAAAWPWPGRATITASRTVDLTLV